MSNLNFKTGSGALARTFGKRRRAFSLFELLMVLLILGIITGATLRVQSDQASVRNAAAVSIRSALEQMRELAINQNAVVQIQLNQTAVSVRCQNTDGTLVSSSGLAPIFGLAAYQTGQHTGTWNEVTGLPGPLRSEWTTETGEPITSVLFDFHGSITADRDRVLVVSSEQFSSPIRIRINSSTGLIGIQP